ncbi:DEAD/DEAH box helicase [Photobacterium aquae]|uniref:DEAD/DEAH box helicase n=1 Tax=Photobacterium aquae TaxID=1195763 RepID=A0A0J1K589_9GAMM|nr:ATP-dependent RNA helicase DbpA [Photobacterium aquae]KLV09537.1 DEAD/DEAH box helicase [Photobacterium aquae]
MSKNAFSTLNLKPELVANLATLGYESMTPIQSQSLPPILEGKDVIAQGKTGSGKTAAFGLGLLEHLNVKRFRVQSLVLCPTRELADQVAKEIRKLARSIHNIKVLTLCGGMPFGPQIGSLEHGAHIIVGTPGRIEEHVRKGFLSLDDLNLLVLDEADRMLEMGFQDSLDAIVDAAPAKRQTLLFSATYPKQIESVASRIMFQPVMVKVESTHDDSSIDQHFYHVDSNEDRMTALRLLLAKHRPESTVVFCNTKIETQDVADELERYGFSAVALHGDLEQRERDQTLVRFANKSTSVLVATDVAARGLDVDALDCVINYHLARDTEVHIHRIGRTGRAGSKGVACSFFSDKEHYKVALLEDYLDKTIEGEALPPMHLLDQPPMYPHMTTLQISGGKKQKLRPGDILGALTGENGIRGDQVGKINVFDMAAYVAVNSDVAKFALKKIENGKMKGRSFRVRVIRG